MASRLKAAVQHIHGRIRIDENWFITSADQLVSKQIISREQKNFEGLMKSIEPEYKDFLVNLNSRHMEQGLSPGENIGSYYYTSSQEPPYSISRSNSEGQVQVFSLNEIPEYKKMSQLAKSSVGTPVIRISDKEDKVIAIVDLASNDRPSLFVKDLQKNRMIDQIVLASSAAWSKDGTFFYYTVPDKNNRPAEIKIRKIGKSGQDASVLSEPNEAFFLELNETKDKKFTLIYSTSRTSTEVHYIDRVAPSPVKLLSKRINTRYFVEHNKGFFYVITNQDSEDFKLVKFPVKGSFEQRETVLEGPFLIDEIDMYEDYIVVYSRVQGVPVIKVLNLLTGSVKNLELPYRCKTYSIQPGSNLDYLSKDFTFVYSSASVYEDTLVYDFASEKLKITNSKKIRGAPLRLENIRTERLFAPSFDGEMIPITLNFHNSTKKDRKNRVLIKGYGAYGEKADQSFKYSESVAVDQGWVIATAHVRGESEKGLNWHSSATKENKYKSFKDFLSCAYFLVKEGYTHKKYLAGYGSSAGGLLLAQCMNLSPELFAAMVLEVPFVDPLSEMLNPDLPLSVTDRDEWGDPLKSPKIFDEIRSYSPYENLSYSKYPPILITASINDSRVSFPSVLKYIQRLRNKTIPRDSPLISDQNIALSITEGGHFGQGDLKNEAVIWGFLNKVISFPAV